jgi:hypothetical protein
VVEKESISRFLDGSVREVRIFSSIDQRPRVVFLQLKGLSAKAKDTHAELGHVLGSDVIACSIATKHIAEDQGFSIIDTQFWRYLK